MWDLYYRKIRRRGGTYAVVLPRPLMRSLGLRNGDYLRWAVHGRALALRREGPRDGIPRDEDGAPVAPQGG